eukprot:TRINITY_DN2589_c0_g3_i1.p1 TRINITY_DN2589_c0_g3~~TRINITY_DN2589_c0_g3_i1.p1  ORF type:complete len:286 (+),score=52.30 TRINITY_DN2589_c0_g3_i1:136-993(+)
MLFIVRHGEREDMVEGADPSKVALEFDPELTELGKQQAFETGSALRQIIGNLQPVIVASPFLRCLQTAYYMSKGMKGQTSDGKHKVVVEDGFCEFLKKEWFKSPSVLRELHSRSNKEISSLLGPDCQLEEGFIDRGKTPLVVEPSFPESVDSYYHRIIYFFTYASNCLLEDDYKDKALIIVSHGYTVQFVLDHYNSFEITNSVDYCCITQFAFDREKKDRDPEIVRKCDDTHLLKVNKTSGNLITSITTPVSPTTTTTTTTITNEEAKIVNAEKRIEDRSMKACI